MSLNLNPNFMERGTRYYRDFSPGDDFYQLLIDAHEGLTDEQSAMLNVKLVLLLANHVGDLRTIREAIELAGQDT